MTAKRRPAVVWSRKTKLSAVNGRFAQEQTLAENGAMTESRDIAAVAFRFFSIAKKAEIVSIYADSPAFVFNRNCEKIGLLAAPIPRAFSPILPASICGTISPRVS